MTGKYEEKHAKAVDTDMGFFDDKKTHIFRLGQLTDQPLGLIPIMLDIVPLWNKKHPIMNCWYNLLRIF